MNLSQFLVRVRDEIDDNAKLKYSDAEIVRHIDEQARSLCRMQMKSNKEWSNFAFMLQKEDAKTLFLNTYEWRLPTWVENIVRVYRRLDTDGTGETTFSPYKWTSTPPTLGQAVLKTDNTRRSGWSWEGQHTFRIWNWQPAPELTIEVVVDPCPMFRATIAQIPAPAVATSLFLPNIPAATDLGDYGYLEEGRYLNGEIQVSSTSGPADVKLGETRRIIYSNASTIVSGTRRHQLELEFALSSTVAVGDVFETLIPVAAQHSRILMLKVVNACAIKKFNIDLQRSIAAEMQEESAAFMEWAAKPRDSNGPFFYLGSQATRAPYDPDKRQFGWLQGA